MMAMTTSNSIRVKPRHANRPRFWTASFILTRVGSVATDTIEAGVAGDRVSKGGAGARRRNGAAQVGPNSRGERITRLHAEDLPGDAGPREDGRAVVLRNAD